MKDSYESLGIVNPPTLVGGVFLWFRASSSVYGKFQLINIILEMGIVGSMSPDPCCSWTSVQAIPQLVLDTCFFGFSLDSVEILEWTRDAGCFEGRMCGLYSVQQIELTG